MLIGMIPALSSVPPVQAQDECETYPMCVFLHPGVADSDKPGFSHTLDTLWGTQNGGVQSRQLFDNYLDYAILASASEDNPSSIGDLQFDITVVEAPIGAVEIYVPPEFKFTAATKEESIWTDMTNDYVYVSVLTASEYDPVAPGWTRIIIGIGWWGSGPLPATPIGSVIEPGTYHIRLFGLAAPAVAGLYHFKIYYWLPGDLSSSRDNPLYWNNLQSLGAGNFPVIIVKSELNPAWVAATVRTELYFNPPLVSGQVVAEGTTPEGRAVKAQAYWGPNEFVQNVYTADLYGNPGAEYQTYIFGLAEGTYDITAYASGAVPKKGDRFTVLAGQSYHAYMTVYDSPDVLVTIYSKHGTGETLWHNLWQLPAGTNDPYADPCDDDTANCPRRDILIELYNSDNQMVGFWASDDMAIRNPISGSWRKWFGWANRLGWTGSTAVDTGFPLFALSTGLNPLATSASFHLVDNYDLTYYPRGYPGTRWDGHVPWDTADYVDGIVNGAYTVESFVTGYIMDGPDAYQRSFVVSGIDKSLPFDLRRTNWIETTMHLPSGIALSDYTTVVLTAEDANGGERAAAAFRALPGTIDRICGARLDELTANCPIVLEGKNGIFPNIGSSLGRGTGAARHAEEKDYGLNPTASTHSAGAVALAGNPYTVRLYMADMGQPWAGLPGTGWYSPVGGDPQVSVFLCNSPQQISFTIRPAWLELFIRSVDFEVPAHERPWTFPGSELWITFADANGDIQDYLDPTLYGLIQDAGAAYGWNGFDIEGVDYLTPEGQQVGNGVSPYDFDSSVPACPWRADGPAPDLFQTCAGTHSLLKVRYAGSDWSSLTSWGSYSLYRALPSSGVRPTRLPPGQYTMDIHTHGYVLRRSFAVQVPAVGGADIPVDLIQGAQVRVIASFKHEGILTDFTGFVRVEVLNENDELVGASVYGQAEPNIFTTTTQGGAYLPVLEWNLPAMRGWLEQTVDHQDFRLVGPAQAAGFGITDGDSATGLIDSLFPSTSRGQRAMFSNLYYNVPDCPDEFNPACQVWASWDYLHPVNAAEFVDTDTVVADVYGFYWYFGDPARTWAGGWPTTDGWSNSGPQVGWSGGAWDSGIRGSSDIPNWSGSGGGTYHIKIYAFDYSRQRMYAMGWPLETTLQWGGAEDLYVDMNALATLRGTVSWLDMQGNYRYLPWAQISTSPGPGDNTNAYGIPDYLMWLPAGVHDVSVSTSEAPGVWGGPAEQDGQYTVVVSDGWVGGSDARLDHTEGVPVPELPGFLVPFGLLAALAASVWLLRKRNLNTPLLMK